MSLRCERIRGFENAEHEFRNRLGALAFLSGAIAFSGDPLRLNRDCNHERDTDHYKRGTDCNAECVPPNEALRVVDPVTLSGLHGLAIEVPSNVRGELFNGRVAMLRFFA